ncbi:autophagy protein Apg6-domain-containing protein [Microdochium trichocladiopsis]|uniref:Autophagy protein Apg6-domain-containing protein n=1 Tax=Microdochium trichocladiopsis TaxID=1682393 RepID=A0A9P8Y387_9PEZI|nr:autophagy protein Apg6-domain-containing protein [Microdochium trichocladiopsis]KAH7027674.1 autophagy protein Apg6-domain-containing protein [Microdochium trichocladiopsis]
MYCQKCRTPLKLDSSLAELNPAAFDLLVTSASQQQHLAPPVSSRPTYPHDAERRAMYEQASKHPAAVSTRKPGSTTQGRDNSMSFVLLTESQVAPPRLTTPTSPAQRSLKARRASTGYGQKQDPTSALPHETDRVNRLFEILSARSDIDHPICVECTELLVDGLQKRLEAASKERDAFAGFLKQVQADVPSREEVAESERALAAAKKDEAESMKALLELEKEKAKLDEEIAALEDESRQIDAEEEQFWRERNEFSTQLAEFQNERDSINSKFDHDSQLLTKLQRANVYNDTFSIHHDGNFATINGLRLGRLSTKPVDWPEINAAWGQALLLVVTVADKLGYKFEGYEPLPMGSTSKIVELKHPSPSSSRLGARERVGPPPAPKRDVWDLYFSGDLLSQVWSRKFDKGMVAFLELVRQLGNFVHQQTKEEHRRAELEGGYQAGGGVAANIPAPLTLPYKIDGDKIGDDRIGHYSIKLGITNDEGWTKACKFALTCCKFLIAHASNVSHTANGR